MFNIVMTAALAAVGLSETYYNIGKGVNCQGSKEVDEIQSTIDFDISGAKKVGGYFYNTTNHFSNQTIKEYYEFQICENLGTSGHCGGSWCFYMLNHTTNECVTGITSWEETTDTQINTFAVGSFDTNNKFQGLGVVVRLTDVYKGQNGLLNCPNNFSETNFIIMCDTSIGVNDTHVSAFYENRTTCLWNITLRSEAGCVSIDHHNVVPVVEDDSLSAGTIFLIIVVVLILVYLILGCAYNSFYHGKVGMEAIPNKNFWTQCCRYSKAGCDATLGCLCCGKKTSNYQEL